MIDKILENHIKQTTKNYDEVALLLSGGVDSMSVGFSAHRLQKKVTAYSFKTDLYDSYDYNKAEETAEIMGWGFVGITIPTEDIKDDFFRLLDMGCSKKTQFECTYPFLYIYPFIQEKIVLSGISADGWYGLSKKAMINYKRPKELFDKFREDYFQNKNPAGVLQQLKLAEMYNKKFVHPYLWNDEISKYYMSKSWDELNKPKQKNVVREAFSVEFDRVGKVKNHLNLQLDSKIDKVFESLLDDYEINWKDRTRVMDVCRDWSKQRDYNEQNQISINL
jgi:asparagine synthetase B (glutamine-hydrolysing)|tara:strand:- start:162 stop:995 length:834 start_codon:yes stop_codon:yes gene_type:complete